MTQIIETRKNTFKFYENEIDCINDSSPYLEVKIIVIEKEYGNKKRFYYVDYDYKIITKSDLSEAKIFNIFKNTFPFKNDDCNSTGFMSTCADPAVDRHESATLWVSGGKIKNLMKSNFYHWNEISSEISYPTERHMIPNGEVIYKNDLTSKMVEYILMDDEELEKYTNNNTAQTYRSELMKALVSLWD